MTALVDFIAARSDPGLREALDRLLPKIAQLDFQAIVAATPALSNLQRRFLETYLEARRNKIFTRGGKA